MKIFSKAREDDISFDYPDNKSIRYIRINNQDFYLRENVDVIFYEGDCQSTWENQPQPLSLLRHGLWVERAISNNENCTQIKAEMPADRS